LLKDLHTYGADTQSALVKRYGDDFTNARAEKLLKSITTTKGECFYLNYKGRKVLGLAPNHIPPPWVAETHLYRRSVIKQLQAEGYKLNGWYGRNLLHFSKNQIDLLIAAKHDGYSAKGIRRIMRKLKQGNQTGFKLVIFTPYINRLRPLAQKHHMLDVVQHL